MRRLITELQSVGLNVQDVVLSRSGGAGPAEGKLFRMQNKVFNIPLQIAQRTRSPFYISQKGSKYFIKQNDHVLETIELLPAPLFYSYQSKDGVAYNKIALRHGLNCLASTVIQTCEHWRQKKQCKFCAIQASLQNRQTVLEKTPKQLAEVAAVAQRTDDIAHVVLTTGAGKPLGSELLSLINAVQAIKSETSLPVHVQCLPPEDLTLLQELKDAGADTVGMHIETLDMDILQSVAPAKAELGLARYNAAWSKAVEIFGTNQVSSFLLAGLGESEYALIKGANHLADLGVYPYIVPFRPIAGSLMQDVLPPSATVMQNIYEYVSEILDQKGLHSSLSKAGCVRCGACTALHLFEKDRKKDIVCHIARNDSELQAAFAIRHEVFVDEQKIFAHCDQDEKDAQSIHLVAKKEDQVIGTVRICPEQKGLWTGSRLAVKAGFRDSRAGGLLVKQAMKTVKEHNCSRFLAQIQRAKVPFFISLGWRPVGDIQEYHGLEHQLMEADLENVALDYPENRAEHEVAVLQEATEIS